MRFELAIKSTMILAACAAVLAVVRLSATAAGSAADKAANAANAEMTGPEMLDFKAQLENYEPPNELQIKTLLEGTRAQPHSGQIWITEARLKTFRTNGALEMLAEAPQCIYDTAQRTVSSPGPLQIQSADKRFILEGEGFMLCHTNSDLIISNRVHTVIRTAPIRPALP